MDTAKKIIEYIENEEVPFNYYVLAFLAACTLRNFLEFMVARNDVHHVGWELPVHYTLFYTCFGLTVILLVHLVSGEKLERVARAVLAGFIIIVTPPLTDLLLQSVWRYDILYMYALPEHDHDIFKKYLLFFGDFDGASPGMRVEIFLSILGSAVYVYHKRPSILRALLMAALFYSVLFWVYFSFCFPMKWFDDLVGLVYQPSQGMLMDYLLFLSLPVFLLLMYLFRPKYFKAVVRDMRPTRILHYEMMALFGLAIGYPERSGRFSLLTDVMELYFIMAAVVFAFVFSVVTNNVSDIEIDRISNPGRPSVTGEIPPGAYRAIGYVALFLALAYSLAAGYMIAFLTACFIGNYFLYSMPPFRLKRIPFLSKGIIAVNSLIMVLAGYSFAGKEMTLFPAGIAAFVLICLTLCTNFIDIKDYDGDMAGGIKTLPVILGLKWSKLLIGSFFLVCYALFPYLAGMPELYAPSIICGIVVFLAVNKKTYKEGVVFGLYLVSGAALWVYIIIKGSSV